MLDGKTNDVSVSVVIPTYNCAHLLPQAIESVVRQSHQVSEIIVVDDGSTDQTAECVQPFLSQIRYIRQENRGLAGARNRGIRESKGAVVAFLDADDLWLSDKIERQLPLFNSSPDVALTFTDAHVLSSSGRAMPTFMFGKGAREGHIFDVLLRSSFILPSTAMITRECFNDVGLFDEGLLCVEDLDLWLRISHKYQVKMIPEPLAVWRRQEGSLTTKKVKMGASSIQVYKKWLARSSGLNRTEAKIVRRQISKCYFEVGFALREQNRPLALKNLLLSLKWNAGNFKSWRALFTTSLPTRLLQRLQRLRDSQEVRNISVQ